MSGGDDLITRGMPGATAQPGAGHPRAAPAVGHPHPHDSAPAHVSGRALYTDDIPAPRNCLHLAFGLSERARAEVISMNLAPVRAMPGVVDVLTAADLPFANDVSPSGDHEPLLCTGEVYFHGQPLFIVVATSHHLARRAARAAVVEYRDRPAALTIDDALAIGSRLEEPIVVSRGDWQAGIAAGTHVIEGRLELGGQEHFYLEGQAALALPAEDGMHVHSSTQHPSEIQHKVAEALGLPFAAVTVETRRMGGGFGGKESQGNALACACAIAAGRTGRPCRMRYDRDDDMRITGKRHEARIDYRCGFDGEGRITGIRFDQYIRCGWSQDLSLAVADRSVLHADNAYYLPAVQITSERLVTNTASNTAFRGFGGPQGLVGIERVMDHIAATLGADPLAIRQANLYGGPGRLTTPYLMEVTDNIAPELVAALAERSDYHARRAAIEAENAAGPIIRRGIALTPVKFGISFTLTHLNQAGALVHVYTDGSIHLNHGGTEMGQGLNMKVAQVAAEVFGQPVSAVRITPTHTGKVPNTSATAASSGSDLNGMATRAACETIRERLAAFAAERWQVSASEVRFEEGTVRVGAGTVGFAELARAAYQARVQLSATGFYATPRLQWDRRAGRGRPFFYFAYGAAVTEVALDTLTGENRILRTDILHDVGRSLNPALDLGQIEGGYVQGAGWLMTEELVWDKAGRLTTHAPSTYKIPACSDRPRALTIELWKGDNPEDTIYRSKAVGEPPFMLGTSAFLALSHAVASCGDGSLYPALDAPATPERLLRAIDAQRGEPW